MNYIVLVFGVFVGVVGFVLFVVGVIVCELVVGILGFVIMFGGVLVVIVLFCCLMVLMNGLGILFVKLCVGFMDLFNEWWECCNDDEYES